MKVVSGSDSHDKSVDAPCPRGKRAIGSGATIAGGNGQVHLMDLRVLEERDTYARFVVPSGSPSTIQNPSIHPEPWAIEAHTVCVQPTFG